jgi:hypothetical protein
MAATKTTSSARTSTRAPDAIAMLRADHERVTEMFERYEGLRTVSQKAKLASEICREISVHAQLEEEIFYPAVREAIEDDDLMDEADVEHQSAKDLCAQIEESSAGDELFDARVKVLGEYIKHHVKEEQNEMFAQVRKSDVDLKALAEQMRTRKQELTAQMD